MWIFHTIPHWITENGIVARHLTNSRDGFAFRGYLAGNYCCWINAVAPRGRADENVMLKKLVDSRKLCSIICNLSVQNNSVLKDHAVWVA